MPTLQFTLAFVVLVQFQNALCVQTLLLLVPHSGIGSIPFQELLVCPPLTDHTLPQHQNLVRMDDGGQPKEGRVCMVGGGECGGEGRVCMVREECVCVVGERV